jgi:uncharacterized protein (TIGR03086 family)
MSPDTGGRPEQSTPPEDSAVLGQALRYALTAAGLVTPDAMTWPTPCRGWNLRMLLAHACESLAALAEGLEHGHIAVRPADSRAGTGPDLAREFRSRGRELLRTCGRDGQPAATVTVGDCPLASHLLALAGGLEIAVHGWDIGRTCGGREPIPAPLATELLAAAPLLITEADRPALFAPQVGVAAGASPSDQLTAYLGRCPA